MDDQEREFVDLERILIDESMVPIKLSLTVIKSITNNFSEDQVIGRGGFGVVYQGTLHNGKVAIKKLSTMLDPDDKQFWEEINCLVRAKHKNVVRFLGYCADTQGELINVNGRYLMADVRQRILCFEYVPNGSLDRYLKGRANALDWNRRFQIITGICHGLHYLHQQRINHLDLKPQNVLLDIHMEPKITDFGLSRWLEDKSKTFTDNICGTLGYVAPEMINDKVISFKSDIYSLGIMMTQLMAGCNMHGTTNSPSSDIELVQMNKCTEIAQSCIHEDKNKRPTIVDIIHNLKETEIPNEKVILVNELGCHGSSMDQGGRGSLPPMRIICKENDKVSLAVRNNSVVFVTMNAWDKSQLWVQDYSAVGKLVADDWWRKPFALVNVDTGLALIPAERKHDPMRLAQYNPAACVPLSMLWVEGAPVRDNFYMIKLFRDESKAFNGLGANVREGTILGWGSTGPTIGDNILFKIVEALCPPP